MLGEAIAVIWGNKRKNLYIDIGKKDEVIPHSHSKKLFLKANNSKKNLFIDEAMHNNLYDFIINKEVIKFNSLI